MPITYQLPNLPMLGKGSLLLDVFDANGNLTGYQHLGNCTKVEQEIKDDRASLYQSMNSVPSLVATAVKKRDVMLSITGTDFSFQHLAIALMSSGETTLAVAAGTVAAEALASATATKKGKYFQTASLNIDNVTVPPVVKQGATTLVYGTDYMVADPVQGLIYFPLTSAVIDTDAVTIGYNTLVGNFSQVAGASIPFVKGKLRFVPDPTDGKKIGCEWFQVNLSPTGKLGLIADEYGNWELEGLVLDNSAATPNSPYFLLTDFGSASGETGDVS